MNKKTLSSTVISYIFLLPYLLLFATFILIPVMFAAYMSFTDFDTVRTPEFIGLTNYLRLFTGDDTFMQYVLPNTIKFSLIVGPVGYALSFIMAWVLAQIPHKPRMVFALILYSPTMTGGVIMSVLWKIIFSGDSTGYINSMLLTWGFITEPLQFLQSEQFLMNIMIIVTLWGSMGVGFLAMLAGVLNINQELYEAAYIDGMKNRFQEIFNVTIPAMRPQMLFGAIMAMVSTVSAGQIGATLSGSNLTPGNSGQLIMNHLVDYGFMRYEMGYACAISVVLLVFIYAFSILARKLFEDKD